MVVVTLLLAFIPQKTSSLSKKIFTGGEVPLERGNTLPKLWCVSPQISPEFSFDPSWFDQISLSVSYFHPIEFLIARICVQLSFVAWSFSEIRIRLQSPCRFARIDLNFNQFLQSEGVSLEFVWFVVGLGLEGASIRVRVLNSLDHRLNTK